MRVTVLGMVIMFLIVVWIGWTGRQGADVSDKSIGGGAHYAKTTERGENARFPDRLEERIQRSDSPSFPSAKKPKDDFDLLSADGDLSYAIVDQLALSQDEAIQAQTILDDYMTLLSELAIERMSVDTEYCDLDRGITSYLVEPFGDLVGALNLEAKTKLVKQLGEEKGGALSESLLAEEVYPNGGKTSIRFRLQQADGDTPSVRVQVFIFDKSGNTIVEQRSAIIDARPGIYENKGIFARLFEITEDSALPNKSK